MKSLKLNRLKLNQLSKKQLEVITGGGAEPTCTCGCCYANNGGANTGDNMAANYDGGLETLCPDPIPVYY